MRWSCLTRIYPYSSKSFMAFSGSLKLSVNSYSEEKESIMVYTVKLLTMNIAYVPLVYINICIKLYTCLCYCVASLKKESLIFICRWYECYCILFVLSTLQSTCTYFYCFPFKSFIFFLTVGMKIAVHLIFWRKHGDVFVWISKSCFRNQKS